MLIIIVLVCALFSRALSNQGRPKILNSNETNIIKNVGEPIFFQCIGFKKIFFYYPTNYGSDTNQSEKVISSKINVSESNEDWGITYNFSRPNSVPGDTGFYGCSYHNKTITLEDYNSDEFSWVYVYVDSPTSTFVENVVRTIKVETGSMAIIPCRPTSPFLKVTLFDQMDNEVDMVDRVSFDPRFGFNMSDLSLHDSGLTTCLITTNGIESTVNYHLDVFTKQEVNEPKIIMDTLRHVIYGQTLHVNCTIDLHENLIPFQLDWKAPNNNKRITQKQDSVHKGSNLHATTEIIIQNVTEEDEGEYECIITVNGGSNKSKMNLMIHDPNKRYINLTSQDPNRNYTRKKNSHVMYVVYYDAFPEVQLKWYDKNYVEKDGNWTNPEVSKIAVHKTLTSTILRINRLDVSDSGIYTLEASNEYEKKFLNFSLTVLAKPTIMIENKVLYYSPGQISEVDCYVISYPEPEIYWTFLQCPNYPSQLNSSLIELNHTTDEIQSTKSTIVSKASMKINMSGIINCTACNSEGCESSSTDIMVSDGVDEFGIIEPGQVIEGDNIEIICAASIYNYTNKIVWQENNSEPILENDRIKIISNTTLFTHRAILQIKNVHISDSTTYTCVADTKYGDNKTYDYNLIVYKKKKPFFTDVNLNQTNLKVDFGKENHKLIILKCYVDGMPKPKVSWYKDKVKLKPNEQYEFKNDNQELHIKFVFEYDSGQYSCRAESSLGMLEAFQNITIMGKELPKELIILIVILVIILIFLILYFTIKVNREKKMRKELLETGLMHFEEGALECLNPELTVDDQAELLPYDKKWEFPRERLKLGKQLGSGAFGVVMKAEARGINEGETVTTVAVKMVRRATNPTYVRALASELKIMVHLGKHLNVVNLLGACTKNISKRELLVIVEYCRFGNLHNYLLRHRMDFINQIDPSTCKFDPSIGVDLLMRTTSINSNNRIKYAALSFSRSINENSGNETAQYYAPNTMDSENTCMSPDGCILSNNSSQSDWRFNYRGDYKDYNLKPICTQDLLSWAFQVARGMEYLSQRNVLHGDLAARNILLAENNIVKICDFGLAKTMYKDGNYKKKGDGPLPIKWMAIESIRDRVFSTQSDIWSFGIVLWEFFTLAETPYPGMEAEIQYQKLIEGYRMEQPTYSTPDIYNIMLQCWKAKPTLRPGFTELVTSIGDLLEESVKTHYITLNTPYMDMNTMILDGKNDYLTMMSAPDHTVLSLPVGDYVNSPISENIPESAYLCMSPTNGDESGIFSPRVDLEKSRFEFPSVTSDTEDAIELSPMLKNVDDDDHYLKPINVHERRAEFARKRHISNLKPNEPINNRDSGYCNAPRNLFLMDLSEKLKKQKERIPQKEENEDKYEEVEKNDHDQTDSIPKEIKNTPPIIKTEDNYVNMPKRKNDLKSDAPDGFSNPSYIIMGNELKKSVV
ncbi:hypothetical protein M0802_007107 [Mischocyttarus mexicanus]|nr:hypothetical protein M0802_007107 [Mischocyttarus mexicanus]